MLFSKNFELVIKTTLRYDNIFSNEERARMKTWLELDMASKTLYARMFFRRRYWYTLRQLRNYSENTENLEATLK